MKSFKEFYGDTWIEKMTTVNSINEILTKTKLASHNVKTIDEIKLIGDDRVIVLSTTETVDNEKQYKIAIDIVSGHPKWSQLMDMTFNIGADADKKIIIYDNVDIKGNQCDELDEEVAYGFLQIVNYYKNDTLLAKASCPKRRNGAIKYTIISNKKEFGSVREKYDGREPILPSKEIFEQVRFWIIHFDHTSWEGSYWSNSRLYYPSEWFELDPREHYDKFHYDYLSINWDPDGGRIELGNWGNKPELYQEFWDNNHVELQKIEDIVSAELRIENNVPMKIVIKVSNIPFQELVKMSDNKQ